MGREDPGEAGVKTAVSHDFAAHRFETRVDGLDAMLDYVLDDDAAALDGSRRRTMTITHVRVPEPIAGRGIAGDLTAAALAHARDAGWRVVPQCVYAAAYVRRHRQWSDLVDTR
jgi:predicted GNAT family acetyltransferase